MTAARPRRLVPLTPFVAGAAVLLPLFALLEINYPNLAPQSQLAIFAGLSLFICFLGQDKKLGEYGALESSVDILLSLAGIGVCAYVVVQTEEFSKGLWLGGSSLGGG